MTKWSKISSFSTKMPTLLDLFNRSDSPTRSASSRLGMADSYSNTTDNAARRDAPTNSKDRHHRRESRDGDEKSASRCLEPTLGSYFLDELFHHHHHQLLGVKQNRQGNNNRNVSRMVVADRRLFSEETGCPSTDDDDHERIHSDGKKSSQEEELVQCIDCRTFYPLPSSSSSHEVSCTSCQQQVLAGTMILPQTEKHPSSRRRLGTGTKKKNRRVRKVFSVKEPTCRWMMMVSPPPTLPQPLVRPAWNGDTLDSLERALSMVCREGNDDDEEVEKDGDDSISSSWEVKCQSSCPPVLSHYQNSTAMSFRSPPLEEESQLFGKESRPFSSTVLAATSGNGDSPPCVPRRRPSLSRQNGPESNTTTMSSSCYTMKVNGDATSSLNLLRGLEMNNDNKNKNNKQEADDEEEEHGHVLEQNDPAVVVAVESFPAAVEQERLWVAEHRRWLYSLVHQWHHMTKCTVQHQQQQQQQQLFYHHHHEDEEDPPAFDLDHHYHHHHHHHGSPLSDSVGGVEQPPPTTTTTTTLSSSSLSSSAKDDMTSSGRVLTVYN